MPRPDLSRVPSFYHNYILQVPEDELIPALNKNTEEMLAFFETIPEQKYDYRYAPGKWNIREILQHVIDGERVFSYRALRFARMDQTPLPGFDEKLFNEHGGGGMRAWNELVEEFSAVRKSTTCLFASFTPEQLEAEGVANDDRIYVMGIGFICAGHCYHHRNVIIERYL